METRRRRWILVGLLLFAAIVFVAGINWGLPSHAVDNYLFSASDPADPASTYRLSGAGIDHLAGNWDDDPNRAADVAAHPILDRDKPVVLLENRPGITPEQLKTQGDKRIVALLAAQKRAQDRLDAAHLKGDPSAITSGQDAVVKSSIDTERYLVNYDNTKLPGYQADTQRDAVNRARILRRFRLYSNQPDEMITFRALALMHPAAGQFDPRMYQYGGLWIYPVGGLLQAAAFTGEITLTGDRGLYLDHPETFGRLYILARAYSAAWGLIGVIAVFSIVRRLAGGLVLPTVAALCFICMPVVLDLAHEAKPHLPGAVLLLLAVLSASKYAKNKKVQWMILTAILSGAAAGMVLWAAVGLVLIPIAAVAAARYRPGGTMVHCAFGLFLAVAVYVATNPYVAIHLQNTQQRALLKSNLGNTGAMYSAGSLAGGAQNAMRLLALGTSWPMALVGVCGIIFCLAGLKRIEINPEAAVESSKPQVSTELNSISAIDWMLAIPAVIIFIEFLVFAAGKPGEYARFAIFPDITLMIAAMAGVGRILSRPLPRAIAGAILVLATATYGFAYERGFLKDASPENSRMQMAQRLQMLRSAFPDDARPVLGVESEPAPYCLPPADLAQWKIVLLPRDSKVDLGTDAPDVVVKPNDDLQVFDPRATPISWANKPFDLYLRKGSVPNAE
jgi:hypothetical protein